MIAVGVVSNIVPEKDHGLKTFDLMGFPHRGRISLLLNPKLYAVEYATDCSHFFTMAAGMVSAPSLSIGRSNRLYRRKQELRFSITP